MKNKESGLYSVFFQAKDTKVMDLEFKRAIKIYEKKENKKESTKEILNNFKEKMKNIAVKGHEKER